jgi:hypothetical protein
VSAIRSQRLAGIALRPHLEAILTVIAAILLLAAAVVAGRTSAVALVVIGIGLAVLVAAASLRWPRTVIVLVILTPILDRYIIADWLPTNVAQLAHFLSEGLLITVGTALGIQAWRRGRLMPALRHPTTIAFAAFGAIAVVSALVNAVPPVVAVAGIGFTIDAAACFFLPRLVGFSIRQSLIAVGIILALVLVSALGGLAQWTLDPNFLGLVAWQGYYGEVYRLASIFTDPNTFGALLIGAIPFAAIGITTLPRSGYRLAALIAAILLFMPLYLSFSRGAWGGLLLGGAVVLAIISWRTLAITFGVAVISLMMAITVPRMVLYDAPPPPAVDVAPDPEPPRQPSLIDSTIARISEIWAGRDLRTLFLVNGAPIVVDHPILGVGPGRYGGAAADIFGTPIYAEYGTDALFLDPQQRTVDNFWLHTLVETGVLGFVAFAAAGLAALVPLVRAARKLTGWNRFLVGGIAAGTAAMAANAVTTMLLEANSVAFVVWFLLGLGSLALGSLGLTRDPATPAVATAEESAPLSSS